MMRIILAIIMKSDHLIQFASADDDIHVDSMRYDEKQSNIYHLVQ